MRYCVLASDMLGGVALYVSRKGHSYIQNSAEREEAGTPDIVGCVRAGLVYHLHTSLPHKALEAREERMGKTLLAGLHTHPRIRLLTRHDASGAGAEEDASASVKSIVSFVVLYGNNCGGEGGGGAFREGLYLHHNFVAALLNDLFGVQARAGCACSGPYAQALLGIDAPLSARFEECLERSGLEVLRPGFVRVGIHFSMSEEELQVLTAGILWVAEHGWKMLGCYTCELSSGEWQHRLDAPHKRRAWLSSFSSVQTLQSSKQEDSECSKAERHQSALVLESAEHSESAGSLNYTHTDHHVNDKGTRKENRRGESAVGEKQQGAQETSGTRSTGGGAGIEMPVTAQQLVEAANDVLVRNYSGPLHLRNTRSPLYLDPQWSALLWLVSILKSHNPLKSPVEIVCRSELLRICQGTACRHFGNF